MAAHQSPPPRPRLSPVPPTCSLRRPPPFAYCIRAPSPKARKPAGTLPIHVPSLCLTHLHDVVQGLLAPLQERRVAAADGAALQRFKAAQQHGTAQRHRVQHVSAAKHGAFPAYRTAQRCPRGPTRPSSQHVKGRNTIQVPREEQRTATTKVAKAYCPCVRPVNVRLRLPSMPTPRPRPELRTCRHTCRPSGNGGEMICRCECVCAFYQQLLQTGVHSMRAGGGGVEVYSHGVVATTTSRSKLL